MSDLRPEGEPTQPVPDRYFPSPAPAPRHVALPTPAPDPRQPQSPRPDTQSYRSYAPAFGMGRPGSVIAAVLITWCVLAVYAFLLGRFFIATLGDFDSHFEPGDVPNQVSDAFRTFNIVAGVLLAWVVVAFVLSVFAFGGRGWARLALTISGGVSVVFQLAASWYVFPRVGALATILAILLLFTGNANDWYRRRT